jgi:pilus assembly protein CpaC
MRRSSKVLIFTILILTGIFLWHSPALKVNAEEEEVIKIILGEIKVIPTRMPSRVAIVNPKIADIADVSDTEIRVSAKSLGTTMLEFTDAFGVQTIKVKVLAEDMDEIKRRVDNLLRNLSLPGVYTQAVDEEAKVLLLGNVKTPQDKDKVNIALGTLKDKIVDLINVKEEERVIEIDVHVLELSKDATSTLGLTWPSAVNLREVGSPGLTPLGVKWSTVFKVLNLQRYSDATTPDPFTFKLDALIQEGKARILSRPRLTCQSGKEAELLVGGEKPLLKTDVVSGGGTGTEVEYKEYGIKLNIKPTVTDSERIKLGIKVDVSEVGIAETIGTTSAISTTTTAKAYPLTRRTASTELFLNDGQTMAIGGLIKQKNEEDIRKVPILGDVPVLGLFFRRKTVRTGGGTGERGETELFITLTPKIVPGLEEAKKEVKEIQAAKIMPLALSKSPTDPVTRYMRIIQNRILENLSYPTTAKEAGFQGTAKLSLHLSYRGDLLDVDVKDSSGYKILDDNAVAAAKSISEYPPFPPSIASEDLWIEIPIIYRSD